MIIHVASEAEFPAVCRIVHEAIETVYSAFYPEDVVRFFMEHHDDGIIHADIVEGRVYLLDIDGVSVGTGTVQGNEIQRVFVLPSYQRKGYGTLIMRELESIVARDHKTVRLDSSLPGYGLYLKLGYRPISYRMISTPGGQVLCYHEMEKALIGSSNRLSVDSDAGIPCFDGKQFEPSMISRNGEASRDTIFSYHQDGNTVWAEFSGGAIDRGFLIGTIGTGGALDFAFEHVNRDSTIRTGRGHSDPEILPDGRIRLREQWFWTNGDCSSGESVLDELR